MAMRLFKKGERLESRTAAEWNALLRDVEQARADASFAKASVNNKPQVSFEDKTVIVTAAPAKHPTTGADLPYLTVQEVSHPDIPPAPCTDDGCTIIRVGDPFEAYADYGLKMSDFEDAVVNPGDELDSDTAYFDIVRRRGVWIVKKREAAAGTTTALALPWVPSDVNTIPAYLADTQARTLFVMEVTIIDGVTVEIPEDAEEAKEVFCWPRLKRSDFTELITANQIPVIRTEKHDGFWFARQLVPLYLTKPERTRPAGGCVPR